MVQRSGRTGGFIEPCLPSPAKAPPSGPDWLHARMARFVVADITNAKSIPQELSMIVPHLPSVPVQPLLLKGSGEYSMFEHFKLYPWVLETYEYPSSKHLIAGLSKHVIGPAEKYAQSKRRSVG